jgi:hypothetical protein
MKKILRITMIVMLVAFLSPLTLRAQLIYTGADLDINNVKARINNELSHFWDPASQVNYYEVPKGTGNSTIYAGSLWIGGLDPQNNLHVAAQTYNQQGEVAFYPGPLDTITGTSADPNVWNQIWKVNKADIDYHITHWNTSGYVIPASILNWPGNAPAGSNYNPILAPFFDANANGIYEPAFGEFPVIIGDQAIYFICNDNHAPSQLGVPNMGVEIHGMAYEFDRPNDPALNNTVFMKYQIANYSGVDYHNVSVGVWTDFDLGNSLDDYAGTDIGSNLVYGYNSAPQVYDPAQGVKFLSPSLGKSVYYVNTNNIPTGNPAAGADYYNYMNSIWLNGAPVTYGGEGNGTGPGATASPTNYMFSGTTDSLFPGQDWTMALAGLQPTDIRMVGSTGLLSLPAGGHVDVELAYITGFAAGPLSAVNVLEGYSDDLGARYANGTLTAVNELKHESRNSLQLSPSLVENQLTISFSKPLCESYQVEVVSLEGKTILTERVFQGNVMLDLSAVASGLYLVRVKTTSECMVSRIVKK